MIRESIHTSEGAERQEGQETGDSSSNGTVEEMRARIEALEAENRQLQDKALRAVADLENVRRRSETERIQTLEYANEQLLKQILPVVDDFARSIESGGSTRDFESFYKGIELIQSNLTKLLERIGVRRMDPVGQPFDVHLHEAIMRQPSDAEEDTVIAVVEPGYTYHDRVLRHAKVIISAGV